MKMTTMPAAREIKRCLRCHHMRAAASTRWPIRRVTRCSFILFYFWAIFIFHFIFSLSLQLLSLARPPRALLHHLPLLPTKPGASTSKRRTHVSVGERDYLCVLCRLQFDSVRIGVPSTHHLGCVHLVHPHLWPSEIAHMLHSRLARTRSVAQICTGQCHRLISLQLQANGPVSCHVLIQHGFSDSNPC